MLAIESTQHQHQHDLINDIDIDLIHQHQRQLNDFNIAQLQLQYEQCVFSSLFYTSYSSLCILFLQWLRRTEEGSERADSFEDERFKTSPVLTVWLVLRATANRPEHNRDNHDRTRPSKILDTHPKLGTVYLTFCFGFDVERP